MREFIIWAFIALMAGSAGSFVLFYTKHRNKKDNLMFLLKYTLIMTAATFSLAMLRRFAVQDEFIRIKDVTVHNIEVYSDYTFNILNPEMPSINIECGDGDETETYQMLNVDEEYSKKLEELLKASDNKMVIYQVKDTERFFPVLPSAEDTSGIERSYYSAYSREDPKYRSMKYFNMAAVFGGLSVFLMILGLSYTRPQKERENVLDLDEAIDGILPEYYENPQLTDGLANRYVMVNDPSLYKTPNEAGRTDFKDAEQSYHVNLKKEKEDIREEPFKVRSPEDIFDPSLKSEEDILDARDELLIQEARRSREQRDAKF